MGIMWTKINIGNFNKDAFLRLDPKFRVFADKEDYTIWKSKNLIKLVDVMTIFPSPKLKKGDLGKNYSLIDLANVERRANSLINIEQSISIGSDKNLIKNGDIVIPKLEPKKGQFFLNLNHNEYLGSTEFVEYKINREIFNPSFLYYLLVSPKLLNVLEYLESGKTHRRVNSEDLLKLKIPKIPIEQQNEIVNKITPIEQEIKQLKESKKDVLDIINEVFEQEFNFDWEASKKYLDKPFHKINFVSVSNDELKFDISLKYRKAFAIAKRKVKVELIDIGKIAQIKGGKRLPKGQNVTEEETGYKYIRVDDLNWDGTFDIDSIKYISEENHLKIKNYIARKNDILLTIVGATVGKCGIVPEELDNENITENFARIIINDQEGILPKYFEYCLQSNVCQFQFDEYTGKASQGKLALFRIKKVQIPYIEFNKQLVMVEEIKSKIDEQKEIDIQIEAKQNKINNLIIQSIGVV